MLCISVINIEINKMSCLPVTWDSRKRTSVVSDDDEHKKKKNRLDFVRSKEHDDIVQKQIRNLLSLKQEKMHNLSSMNPESDVVVEASAMLSAVPFYRYLKQIDQSSDFEIPVVTRDYEENFMRGPTNSSEKLCSLDKHCECMNLDSKIKFVGIQFVIPTFTSPIANTLCIFCLRKITQLLYYETIDKNIDAGVPIQKYGNISGEANEYHPSSMLFCMKGGPIQSMPLPIVAHQRNHLKVEVINGIPYIKQQKVYMEDFC